MILGILCRWLCLMTLDRLLTYLVEATLDLQFELVGI